MKNVKLTSTEMVHTPGILRWMQCRYQTEPFKTNITALFAQTYGLSRPVASGVLSGRIPVTIDEDAGTVTFSVSSGGVL